MNTKHQETWDKIWRDIEGEIVIWQRPNLLIIIWAVFTTASLFVSSNSRVGDILSWVGIAALVGWSLLEIFKGVNYFRRFLGLVVLVLAVATIINIV